MGLLTQPAYLPEQSGPEANKRYKRLRLQVFTGAFVAYAGFYLVRKNFSMAMPFMAQFGFEKGEFRADKLEKKNKADSEKNPYTNK